MNKRSARLISPPPRNGFPCQFPPIWISDPMVTIDDELVDVSPRFISTSARQTPSVPGPRMTTADQRQDRCGCGPSH